MAPPLRKALVALFSTGVAAATIALGAFDIQIVRKLPKLTTIEDYQPPLVTEIRSADGVPLAELYDERRKPLPLNRIPLNLIHAVLAAEDVGFFQHGGVNLRSIARAFFKNLFAGEIVQGGSTITQQVAKSLLLGSERNLTRKIREALLAYRIERSLSKREILEIYLNQIFFGYGAYGVEAAAENYFGKEAKNLTLAEAALLAGLPPGPSRFSPAAHPDRAKARQAYVLERMVEVGFLTRATAEAARTAPIVIRPRHNLFLERAPYFSETLRRDLEERYGHHRLYTAGLRVETTLDSRMQEAAEGALEEGVRELDHRQGYRGPEGHIEESGIAEFREEVQRDLDEEPKGDVLLVLGPRGVEPKPHAPPAAGEEVRGVVTRVTSKSAEVAVGLASCQIALEDLRWARPPNPEVDPSMAPVRDVAKVLRKGDLVRVRFKVEPNRRGFAPCTLEQEPLVQGALLALNPETGEIQAMVGGNAYEKSAFNRAVQARRQPGSAFKPIYFAAALDRGYTPSTMVLDSPYVYEGDQEDQVWKPRNYEGTFSGFIPLREALAKSVNNASIRILADVGVDDAIAYARKLGIASPLSRDMSLALGSSGVSLLELTRGYGVFASGGYLYRSYALRRVRDAEGHVLEEHRATLEPPEEGEGAASPATAPEGGEARPGTEPTEAVSSTLKPGQVLSEQTAFLMTHLLRNVVEHGTGWRARALGRPAVGKTGTTEDYRDAWFVGYTPSLVAGVWLGFDAEVPLGRNESGGRAATPVWLDFMQAALKGKPVRDFPVPEGIVFARIDPKTGLLANARTESPIFEAFREGTVPEGEESSGGKPQDTFYKYDLGL